MTTEYFDFNIKAAKNTLNKTKLLKLDESRNGDSDRQEMIITILTMTLLALLKSISKTVKFNDFM